MPWYKHRGFLQRCDDVSYDTVYDNGSPAPYPGIYQCPGCMAETVARQGEALPALGSHVHENGETRVGWRLLVCADKMPKWSGSMKHPAD